MSLDQNNPVQLTNRQFFPPYDGSINSNNGRGLEWKLEELPWSEQKNPWRHLEQSPFVDELVAEDGGGIGCFGVAAAFVGIGFSIVCLPVLHLNG